MVEKSERKGVKGEERRGAARKAMEGLGERLQGREMEEAVKHVQAVQQEEEYSSERRGGSQVGYVKKSVDAAKTAGVEDSTFN